ncbi:ABC-type transport auxiliary lipoprotein family protein [Erythrobacter sp.]|uniref:ABC-type transport auxiliary lipoprotein family protein n=1 Tax=Erythrobacter sp. TaxID=1042 RepID=UPI001425C9BC|nr:ABC-type transport auxiliary lipoprotein family protein [Erythrobacter sp.]QIQ86900.1 MAG: ABC transporter [Erythrobacter sp.]
MNHSMLRLPRLLAFAALPLALAGCVSIGESEPPESLLTLTSTARAPAGTGAEAGGGSSEGVIAVKTPEAAAKLDVLRVPVAVNETEVAYLKQAYWVEKPARLFRRLLGETLRTRMDALVLDGEASPSLAGRTLSGTLLDMGYDASAGEVVVRYDAVLTRADGRVVSRRFEAMESVAVAEAGPVGAALNRAANTLAGEVADWLAAQE